MTTRSLRAFIGAALTLLLGVMLLATIYFTLFDLQWVAFLAGVLFAAVSATASQASKAEWLIIRRTRQMQHAKDQFAQESMRHKHAVEALKGSEARFHLVADALPQMLAYIDRDDRVRLHNRAFAQQIARAPEQIDGQNLREVLGEPACVELKAHGAALLPESCDTFNASWALPGDPQAGRAVTLIPDFDKSGTALGFYALIDAPAQPCAKNIAPAEVAPPPANGDGDMAYLEEMTQQLMGGADPRARLMKALEEDQFILFAQKIQPLARTAPYPGCYEVLLRLQEEEDNMAPPGGFFPVAERYHLMGDIDRWVVTNLIASCAKRSRRNPSWKMPLYCVNLDAATLCDPQFASYTRRELERHRFPPCNLCFEIAEPDVLNHHARVKAFIDDLKPAGCLFTLDAFGSVKVSFQPIRHLGLNFIKIDGAIIANMLNESSSLAKIRSIVTVAKNLDLLTIAGCVENDDALAKLREIGIDYAQGFGIGRPGPLAQVS